MFIEIKDDDPNKIGTFCIYLAKYAMSLHGNNKEKASEFIGISKRAFRDWVTKHPELHHFRHKVINPPDGNAESGNRRWGMYQNNGKWKTKVVPDAGQEF